MLYPITLFVKAKLIFPNKLKGKRIDLKKFYYKNFSKFFGLLIFAAMLSIVYNLFILNLTISDQFLQLLLMVGFSLILYKRYTNEWIHEGVSLTVTLIMCAVIIVEWNTWLVN
jgi:predicted tellurium resistance membrane protein TerC